MLIDLANDRIGCIPMQRAYDQGGYEPEASFLASGCGEPIVDEAVRQLTVLTDCPGTRLRVP